MGVYWQILIIDQKNPSDTFNSCCDSYAVHAICCGLAPV
ncbi:hypothetical protein GDI2683 [Gluconacetobacter diazotrophicus PA1 5]|uniref:Uncharacterized protein n=1 Tax=Gluconacetobacter diazotrophicus (strain ATCC 49037 / DSM 5601 / CCUG 37298 / CIP 103539 / LMG 7603 / PAl5) TaxID=272568 RepID=A9HPS3_GLUDA|nr:hypothetical protein GDI2683 [Gluconacetobacter diazotrophicus PA1 5]